MHKKLLTISFTLAALSVVLGAFAAHGLKKIVSDSAVAIFETGVKYQFYHALGIALAAILYKEYTHKIILNAAYFFLAGIIFFSGSLYILTYKEAMSLPGLSFVGPITPLGGFCFIIGWVLLATGIHKKSTNQ